MIDATTHPALPLFRSEIERFQSFAQLRCTSDQLALRRRIQRCQRSWPLVVACYAGGRTVEHSAALHDASSEGIGFMGEHLFTPEQLVFVRLFWHDPGALWIPATVRHVRAINGGTLVGTQYAFSDGQACDLAMALRAGE